MAGAGGTALILFSHDIFSAQSVGGVTRCMIEIMRGLDGLSDEWRLWAGAHANAMLDAAASEPWLHDRLLYTRRARRSGRLSGSLRNEPGFARRARDARVVHRTYYPVIDLIPRDVPTVETLHDMSDECAVADSDRLASLKSLIKRRALERATCIVCVSQSARRELIALWPWAEARAVVIHHGVRKLAPHPEIVSRPRPYFLFVGRRDFYKNFPTAAEALAHARLPDHELLCFGGGPFTQAETELLARTELDGRVHQLTGSDAYLAGLYEGATALLYPSRYEGFGLPVLEAMIHRCPVIAAPVTSLPEVGGDAALYADADRPDEWAAVMERLAGSPDEADRCRTLGEKRTRLFSWSRAAEAYAALYRDLC